MRRLVLIALVLLPLVPARAEAVTVRDIIELTRAGLGEDVLLALIEVDRSVFPIDTKTITRLKQAGVSERVIEAIIRSGRTREAGLEQEPAPVYVEPPPPTPTVVIDRQETIREVPVAVPVPVYVPIVERRVHHVEVDTSTSTASSAPSQVGTDIRHEREEPKSQPVYWGWGGQLRPDAWKPK